MTSAGSVVHVLCLTRGEASTINESGADLRAARAAELRQASAELGVTGCTLLDYPDARLPSVPQAELEAAVTDLATRHRADGLLVFDDTGVTGHPDHKAATAAAVGAARAAALPVLAWTIPEAVASQLRAETGARFAGQASRRRGPVRPGRPHPAAACSIAARQPGLTGGGAVAAAAAAGRLRAPALDRTERQRGNAAAADDPLMQAATTGMVSR